MSNLYLRLHIISQHQPRKPIWLTSRSPARTHAQQGRRKQHRPQLSAVHKLSPDAIATIVSAQRARRPRAACAASFSPSELRNHHRAQTLGQAGCRKDQGAVIRRSLLFRGVGRPAPPSLAAIIATVPIRNYRRDRIVCS